MLRAGSDHSAGVVPFPAATAVLALALMLLLWSFGRDILWLWRGRRRQARHPGTSAGRSLSRLADGASAISEPLSSSDSADLKDRMAQDEGLKRSPRLSVVAVKVQAMGKSTAGAGYRCTECGWQSAKWTGRCAECQAWGTVEEAGVSRLARAASRGVSRSAAPASTLPVPIGQVDATDAAARPTGLDELDRVLGGGLVPGAVVLLAGEPGVGKSTLLLEAGALVAETGPVLYVTGEESAAQVRLRADRIGAVSAQLFLAAETDLDAVLGHVAQVEPRLLIIDSVQTIAAAGVDGVPGGVTQVREVAAALTAVAKEHSLATILVGHVTKDGSVAGPRTLEHLVDVVLHFDGDRHSQLRMVRAVKNRYGPTDEVGCFDLGEYGLIGLPDPSGLFLSQHREPVPGTCVTVTMEGRRPLPAEVQALVGNSVLEVPRRTTSGLDGSRVGMVLAVLQRRAGLNLGKQDVYAATVGGVRLTEPSVDLAVAVALASSVSNLSVPHGVVAIGEVGLAGEVRRVAGLARRVAEAERMGFRRVIVPAASGGPMERGDGLTSHMQVLEVEDIRQALSAVLGSSP
jgi:DNA repair protein RadA/Sms